MTLAPETLLRRLFDAGLTASRPSAALLAPHMPAPPRGRLMVLGAGKAGATMAAAVEELTADWPMRPEGLVIVPYDHGLETRHIRVVEAAHPVPDEAGRRASAELIELARGLGPDDLLLALISGGGSALAAAPVAGVPLDDKRAVTRALLASGAPIGAMNTVRRHLSAIKGGRLAAAAAPAQVVTLAISDVAGDDPATIASGPTVPDPTTLADAGRVLADWGITPPDSVARALADPANETPKPGDPVFDRARYHMIATPMLALEAAAAEAARLGLTPLVLGDRIEGEAREVARVMAGMALSARAHGRPVRAPAVLLSGGETTVTVRGDGRGGRNVEFLLALALALGGTPGIHGLAADTDGIDGAEPVAGAIIGPDTLSRCRALGLDPAEMLARNDAHTLFARLDARIVTGATRTNVNDFRAILVM
ncbi:MAG: glycerate kinase [Tistrella sp.]|uniref:Glycerate kinase n=1 Tax=Tistrella mobilis TaxID=171437 RepID=A0A3B9IL14_9PROT|nr:glycerate kinase [Tistrella sp.]MAD38851.1 glycerate kinase [Tistrella sp.]MBA75508.1 glycerate kinase [Tistrella sp.]HAE48551.1 glycerate kinase [Tistrella mobilis]